MPHKLIVAVLILIVFVSLSCSSRQYTTDPGSVNGLSAETQAEESLPSSEQADREKPEKTDDAVRLFVNKVKAEATLLRTDARRLAEEGNLEEARKTLDGALNVILNSGLALDAYPELASLFKDVTVEVVRIEDQLAFSNEEVIETALVDELDDVALEGEVSETESAPNVVSYDLPVVLNNKVERFIEIFQTEQREAFAAGIARSGRFIERFREILKEEGVPQDLVYMAMIESTFKVRAYSRAAARGIWQFMSWTGMRYGLKIDWWLDERIDPYLSCRAAARYLKDLHENLGDWLLAMAAYNGGPGRVGRAVQRMKTKDFWKLSSTTRYLRRETRNFVPAILAATIIMKQPEAYGFGDVVRDEPWAFEELKVKIPTDLRIIAELVDVNVEKLQELNPALRRMITPTNYSDFRLRVPPGKGELLSQKLAALPANKRVKYTEHQVRRGDTLSGIAKRYGSSVASLQKANNISNPKRIKPGMRLIVPLSADYREAYASTNTRGRGYSRGEKVIHIVRRGDSLYEIARAYGTTVGSIAAWNNLDSNKAIHPGNKFVIYARTSVKGTSGGRIVSVGGNKIVYNVKSGDTLYDIAIRYKISVKQLKSWNNLSRNLIKPGDRLTVYLSASDNSN